MKRPTMLFMVFSLLLVTLLVVAPAIAQKKTQKKGKPTKPPGGEEETLMVAFRDDPGLFNGVMPDRLTEPVDARVYIDGDPGVRIQFFQSGNLIFSVAPVKGKKNPPGTGRTLTLDFTYLDSLIGNEVQPGFADGPFVRPSTAARDNVTLYVAPDDGAGYPHPSGIAGMTPWGGFIPTRLPVFFADDEGILWRLTWPHPGYSTRGTGFAALKCVQEDPTDPARCVAWTVQFADIADEEWDDSMPPLPWEDVRGINTTGNAVLWNALDGPSGGVYTMPFKMAICLSPVVDKGDCHEYAQ